MTEIFTGGLLSVADDMMALVDGMRPAPLLPGGIFPADRSTASRDTALGVAASLVLHVLAGILLVVVPLTMVAKAPPEDIAVDLLTPEQYSAITSPNPLQGDRVPVVPRVPPRTVPGMIRATTLLSAAALADPGSARALKQFASLAGDERAIQLCDLEALEQVRAWRTEIRPERLVAYATAEVRIANGRIAADGAAIQNWEGWHRIRFTCDLSPDRGTVVAFEFALGALIPENEWERDGLPADHAGDDD